MVCVNDGLIHQVLMRNLQRCGLGDGGLGGSRPRLGPQEKKKKRKEKENEPRPGILDWEYQDISVCQYFLTPLLYSLPPSSIPAYNVKRLAAGS